jgi:hypothetical protein
MFAVPLCPPGSSCTTSNRRKIVEQSRTCCATQKVDCLAIPSRISSDTGFGGSTLPAACVYTGEMKMLFGCSELLCVVISQMFKRLPILFSRRQKRRPRNERGKQRDKETLVTYAPLLNSRNSSLLATRINRVVALKFH